MPLPKSTQAYLDCEEKFAKALSAPNGMAFTFESEGQAIRFSQRMNTYRSILRKQSKEIYPAHDPRHGASVYDHLKVSLDKENPGRILVQPYTTNVLKEEVL